ncbi:MAG: guanylate kinase [Burkholderiaceae bacterium]
MNAATTSTHRAGSLLIVAAPSGAGKSSLVNALLQRETDIVLSVSFTTRAPRPGEQDGREYFFISEAEFLQRQANAEFLESAQVHGNFYGTSKRLIQEHTQAGRDVLLEIDWQGARQVRQQFPDAVGIFILPPSMPALEHRLKHRGQDSEEVIARRVQNAAGEIAHANEFDYVIINANFDVALSQLVDIARASRCRLRQQAARFGDLFAEFGIQP